MTKSILCLLLALQVSLAFSQDSTETTKRSIGIHYFGELGFKPGIEIDYGINLRTTVREKKKVYLEKQLNLRPSLAYYRYAHYSNNYLLSVKLNYQLKFENKKTEKHLFIEPFIRAGYLRYFLSGDVYETRGSALKEVRFRGSNSLILGGMFDVGGSLTKKADWLLGFDYFAESTEDKIVLHRFAIKLGTRIAL